MNKAEVLAALQKAGVVVNEQGYLIKAAAPLPQFDRKRAGSLWDRGAADSYYHRPRKPHWYPNGAGYNPRIEEGLTPEEIAEYHAGYDDNEGIFGNKKRWDDDDE